jgi:hypothetical protein
MSRARPKIGQRDIAKACKGAVQAGLEVRGFAIDQEAGQIFVFTGKPSDQQIAPSPNDWDSIK